MAYVPDEPTLALAAASAAAGAVAELLRFAREGAASDRFAFDDDTTLFLADALEKAIAIESARPQNATDLESLGQLQHALFCFRTDFGA